MDLDDCLPQPWRNGGGVTRELLAWPVDAAAWTLRVSVAEIEADGPFSAYEGVDRWFAVMAGAGVRLDLARGARTLTAAGPPLTFDGAEAPGCARLAGPTRDLNLMVRRGHGRAEMMVALPFSAPTPGAAWQGLYAAEDAVIEAAGGPQVLAAGTLLWCAGAAGPPWQLGRGGAAWWLSFFAAPPRGSPDESDAVVAPRGGQKTGKRPGISSWPHEPPRAIVAADDPLETP